MGCIAEGDIQHRSLFSALPWQLKTRDKIENKSFFVTNVGIEIVFLVTQENT